MNVSFLYTQANHTIRSHDGNATSDSTGIFVRPRRCPKPHKVLPVSGRSRLLRNFPASPNVELSENMPARRTPVLGTERTIARAQGKENGPKGGFTSPPSSIGIGIETEFLLGSREASLRQATLLKFARMLKDLYNNEVPEAYPRMSEEVGVRDLAIEIYSTWTIHQDTTVDADEESCKLYLANGI